jgi:hypothetical protein
MRVFVFLRCGNDGVTSHGTMRTAGRNYPNPNLDRSAMSYQIFKRNTPDENGHSRIVIDEHDALPAGWEDAKFLMSEDDLPSELRAAIKTKGFFTYRDRRFADQQPPVDDFRQCSHETKRC